MELFNGWHSQKQNEGEQSVNLTLISQGFATAGWEELTLAYSISGILRLWNE